MKKNQDSQNLIIALVLSMLIMTYWQYFVAAPQKKAEALNMKAKAQKERLAVADQAKLVAAPTKPRKELLAETKRVKIKSDALSGSISLQGLRFDDISLVKYREELDPKSPEVVVFSPANSKEGYFAEFGFLSENKNIKLPSSDTIWAADSDELTPTKPINLSWNNGEGVTFSVKIELDDKYMFTISSNAKDATGNLITLQNYGFINRVYDLKNHAKMAILHEGLLGVFDGILKETDYKKITEDKEQSFEVEKGGWLGITDKYWLSALIPTAQQFNSHFSTYEKEGITHYQTEYLGAAANSSTLRLFAGAKEMAVLDAYSEKYNISRFDHAVDLGMFDFLTKPIFKLLTYFYALLGNFGLAILLLTVCVKACMYPLASKSFRSMNQMKKLQPKMAEIRERCKDDKLKLNQAMMELYKKEKVNPASGCLPMVIQFPVFFALYKVLYVTLEMRHAPFYGWVRDLSASDPTNLFTLFGLIDWHSLFGFNLPAVFHLGIFPIIMCFTMVVQQMQSPPPPDPTQAKVMKLMPFFFLFLFASFPAGLVIYWSWSNTLSILQQWYIKKRHGD